ncbi:MAG: hypothetical protein HQ513_15215 [Rhodospirillales bacterium]|nr:hypothetical protein [Rhodospirillales bacterium]
MTKGILTLPKSGTYLWSNILKKMWELGLLNRKEMAASGFYFGHILDGDNEFRLSSDQIAFFTVRDVRGYFLSLCNWIDVRYKKVLEDKNEMNRDLHVMHYERIPLWSKMTFEEKLESLIFQTDKSLFNVKHIESHFKAACYLITMGVPVIRFEEIASLNSFSEPSDISIETCIKAISYLGVSLNKDDASEILRLSWGNSKTFDPEGGPDKWKKALPDDIKRNIELKYNRYITKLGYEV